MNIKIGILNVPKHCNKHDLIHFVTPRFRDVRFVIFDRHFLLFFCVFANNFASISFVMNIQDRIKDAGEFFGCKDLKKFQNDVVASVINGRDVFLMSLTGS